MPEQTQAQDLYVRLIDPTGTAKPVVRQLRTWDRQRLIASLRKQYGEDAKPGEERQVQIITRDEYLANKDA